MTTQTITIVVNEQGARVVQRSLEDLGGGAEKAAGNVNQLQDALRQYAKYFAVGALFERFISNTLQLENSQAQLQAILKSTGGAAGFAAEQLNKMAAVMSQRSLFGSEEITDAQTRLLSYTGVVGTNFPRALQTVIDQSARLKISLTQSAEVIGKALESPTKAAEALSRQGFGASFSAAVKKNIQDLVNQGKTAEVQVKILNILEESYAGAAAAARNTLGGALTQLKKNFDDLFRIEDTTGLAKAINLVADNMATLVKWLGIGASAWVAYWVAANFGGWVKLTGVILGNIGAFIQLASTVRSLSGAMLLLNAAFLANPIGIVIAALAAGVAIVITFKESFLELGDTIYGVFLGAGEIVSTFVAKAKIELAELVNSVPQRFLPEGFNAKSILGPNPEQVFETAGRDLGTSFNKGFEEAQKNGLVAKFGKKDPAAEAGNVFAGGSSTNGAQGASDAVFDRQQKLLKSILGPAKTYKETMFDLNQLLKDQTITLEQYNQAMDRNREKYLESTKPTTFEGGFQKQIELMRIKSKDVFADLGKQMADIFGPGGTLAEGIGDATAQAVVFGKSWKSAIASVAQTILSQLVGSLAKAAASSVLGGLFGGGGGGGSIFGSLASAGLSAFLGFASGGYTGNMGRSQVAGVVHGQEYVMNADATRRNLPLLTAMNNGGSVSSGGGGGMNLSVNINNQIPGAAYDVQQVSDDRIEIIARRVVASDAPNIIAADISNPNSRTSKSIGKYTQANRRRQ